MKGNSPFGLFIACAPELMEKNSLGVCNLNLKSGQKRGMTHENIQREQRVLLKTGSRRDREGGGGGGGGEWRERSVGA